MLGFYDDPASLYGDPTDDPGMGTFDSLALGGLTPMPPQQAAPLRQPPPKRLTTEELAAFLDKAGAEPSRPAPLTGIGQLSGDDLKQAQLGSLWAGLSALGTGISGHWDRAATEGVPEIQAAQDRAVAGANVRQQAGYEASLADFKSKQADQQQKAVVGGLMGYLNDIYDAEPPGSPFVARAEQAAKMGDMGAIEKMAQAEPERRLMWAHGKNPDGPTALEDQQQLQAQLHDLIKKTSLQTLSGPEADAAALKAKAEQDARLPGEMQLKMAPSYQAPPQYEPLDRVAARTELVQGIEDKYLAAREAAKAATAGVIGKVQKMRDGTWALIRPADPSHPKAWADPIDGQPALDGKLLYFSKDEQRYVQNADHPELGAIPVVTHEVGEKGAPDINTIRSGRVAPPPPDSPDASLVTTLHRLNARPSGAPTPQPAAPPASAQDATKKLGGVRDPGLQKRIGAARAAGYSDSEIASFMGIH